MEARVVHAMPDVGLVAPGCGRVTRALGEAHPGVSEAILRSFGSAPGSPINYLLTHLLHHSATRTDQADAASSSDIIDVPHELSVYHDGITMHYVCYYGLLGLTPHEDVRHRWTLPSVGTPARQRIQRAAAAAALDSLLVPMQPVEVVATSDEQSIDQHMDEQPSMHDALVDGYCGGSPDLLSDDMFSLGELETEGLSWVERREPLSPMKDMRPPSTQRGEQSPRVRRFEQDVRDQAFTAPAKKKRRRVIESESEDSDDDEDYGASCGDEADERAPVSDGEGDVSELMTEQLRHVLAQIKRADGPHAAREFKSLQAKITKLLSANADPTVHCGDRETLLHYAAYYGATNLMASLIDHGAEVNAISTAGESVLYWAAKGGNVRAVRLLIERGARVDIRNYMKEGLLHYCTDFSMAILKELVDSKANVNITDDQRNTPLHFLCYVAEHEEPKLGHDKLERILFLISHGANVHARNYKNDTPLSMLERQRLRKELRKVSEALDQSQRHRPRPRPMVADDDLESDDDSDSQRPRKHRRRSIEEHDQEPTVVSSLQHFTICELDEPPEGWPDDVCTYARSLDDVPTNVGKIPTQTADPNANIRRLVVEDAYVEVKPVPEDHPLAGLPTLHRGVFAVRDIPAQTCLFEYTGELVQSPEVIGRHQRFCMLYNDTLDVDAARYGNESRFLNDATTPLKLGQANVVFRSVQARDGPHILVVTSRRVRKGQELLVHYGEDYHSLFNDLSEEEEEEDAFPTTARSPPDVLLSPGINREPSTPAILP